MPPKTWTFFTDRDLGALIADAISKAGLEVRKHKDFFRPATPDTHWIPNIGNRGWVALTHNKAIGINPIERDLAFRSNLRLFFLIGKHGNQKLADNLVPTIPKLLSFLARHEPPYIAKIHYPNPFADVGKMPGSIGMWMTYQEWKKQPNAGEGRKR